MQRVALGLGLLALASAADVPMLPKEYSAMIQMKMPYLSLEMPLRVLTSAAAQKIEYYDGLEVDVSSARGTYKYVFNNSRRVCTYSPAASGPMLLSAAAASAAAGETWSAMPFFPDLSQYKYAGDELVGGLLCQKFTLDAHHGSIGTMDDHLSFYWDAVLGKPVRWHMHSRHVTFGSHTDEYIMDYLSVQSGAPAQADLSLPAECEAPQEADISIQIHSFLKAMRAAHPSSKAVGHDESVPFGAFLSQHGKAYAEEEYAHRRAVFDRNVRLVQELNQQHAGTASFSGNRFSDLTAKEVLRFRGGKNKASRVERRLPEHWQFVSVHQQPSAEAADQMPASFDWRTAKPGVVSPVKDQAMCGSCWTYGLTEPIESIHAIMKGKLVELPEQFVVDCTWTNGSTSANMGCDGGNSDTGALEIVRKFGGKIPSAAAYGNYLSVNGYCKDTSLMEVGAVVAGWVDIPKRNDQALLHALFTVGPISVGIMVPDEMLFYDAGVLKVDSCKHDESQIDHAVVATGFGTDKQGVAFWTIRNSWSTYWGDRGYINIARGELDCCVTCEAGYPDVNPGYPHSGDENSASPSLVV